MYYVEIIEMVLEMVTNTRSSPSEVFLGKGVLKTFRKFTGEHPCQSVMSIKLHRCSPVNLLHILRANFPKNTSEWQLLQHYQRRVSSQTVKRDGSNLTFSRL